MTSGGSSRPRTNSSTSNPVAVSSDSQPPSTRISRAQRSPSSRAAWAAAIAPKPCPADDHPIGRCDEHAGTLCDGDDVAAVEVEVVRTVLGRRVRQPVATQVHGDRPQRPARTGQATRDRCPRPCRVTDAVHRDDARCARRCRPTPVEEMDPHAIVVDCEARRLEGRVRFGHDGRRKIHRALGYGRHVETPPRITNGTGDRHAPTEPAPAVRRSRR